LHLLAHNGAAVVFPCEVVLKPPGFALPMMTNEPEQNRKRCY
jgi:hypothetical protein